MMKEKEIRVFAGFIILCTYVFLFTVSLISLVQLYIISEQNYFPFGEVICNSEEIYNLNAFDYLYSLISRIVKYTFFGLIGGYFITRFYFDEVNKWKKGKQLMELSQGKGRKKVRKDET